MKKSKLVPEEFQEKFEEALSEHLNKGSDSDDQKNTEKSSLLARTTLEDLKNRLIGTKETKARKEYEAELLKATKNGKPKVGKLSAKTFTVVLTQEATTYYETRLDFEATSMLEAIEKAKAQREKFDSKCWDTDPIFELTGVETYHVI